MDKFQNKVIGYAVVAIIAAFIIHAFLPYLILGLIGWVVFGLIGPAQNHLEALYLAVAAAMSSTVIIVKILYDKRELETSTTNIVGQTNYQGDEMPLLIWDAAQSLYRLTVEKEQGAGEYALVEKGPEGLEMYVWDFGVDPAASKK